MSQRQLAQKGLFTIAFGGETYLKYAINLARSFRIHNDPHDIAFGIVTDSSTRLPLDLSFVQILRAPPDVPRTLEAKLFLDHIVYGDQTLADRLEFCKQSLFVDSDCLCFGNLDSAFALFEGNPVCVLGEWTHEGEWCGAQAELLCKQFKLPQLPRFNGGLYYIEAGAGSREIFNTARRLAAQYDKLGFHRHRGWFNEEPLLSLALAIHQQEIALDSQSDAPYSDFLPDRDRIRCDALSGVCRIFKARSSATLYPAIVHFAGYSTRRTPYINEQLKLSLHFGWHCPIALARVVGNCRFLLLWALGRVKNLFRPLYRALFGFRRIKPSDRRAAADQ